MPIVLKVNLSPRKKIPRPGPGLGAILLIAWLFGGLAGQASAFNATTTVDINAGIDSAAQLTISPSAINFPNADPDTVSSIPANENPVAVTVSAQTTGNKTITLTVLAHDDLLSGSNRIPISNVRWTHTGSVFQDGTMSRTTPQTAASWQRSGTYSGTFSFFLNNSWSYVTGNYSQTVTYTLSSP